MPVEESTRQTESGEQPPLRKVTTRAAFFCLELTMQVQQGKEKVTQREFLYNMFAENDERSSLDDPEIKAFVQQKSLDEQWSPEQMAYRAKLENSPLSGKPPHDLSSH